MNLELKHLQVNGVDLAFFDKQADEPDLQTILLIHGLACHARCWDATLRLLNAPQRIVAIELRGHGRSEKRSPYHWHQFGRDLCMFIQTLDLQSVIAAGHSMGGHVLLQAASVLTRRFDGLLLLEPVVFNPRTYTSSANVKIFDSPEDHPFARRRSLWDSPQHWYDTIRAKSPFNLWTAEVLKDHCEYGLEPTADGHFQLRCPPLVEAEASLNCTDTNIHRVLPSVDIPTTVIRAKTAAGFRHPMDNIHSTTWAGLAENLPQGTDKYRPELSHFIPMQRPELVVEELSELLNR